MGKVALALVVSVTVVACSYDAGRLLPPPDATSMDSAGTSPVDKRVALADAGSDGGDAMALAPDASVRVGGDVAVADARTEETPADTRASGAFMADAGKADAESDLGAGGIDRTTFVNGRAVGALSGYGSVSLGAGNSLSVPTCGDMPIGGLAPTMPPVTFNSTCRPSNISWGSDTALCVSGSIPTAKSLSGYLVGWGIMIGVAARASVQPLGITYKTVALSVTGADSNHLLAVVHLSGDDANRTYCASIVASGAPIKLTSFNSECAFGSGTTLSENDIRNIDRIGVEVPVSDEAITLTDFCLTEIDLGK
jgi:hypothetical protein